MKVTYLQHSGFLIELKNAYLLFDYYKGTLPKFDHGKTIFVFSSHRHYDHFQRKIMDFAELYTKIHYILSNDIPRFKGLEQAIFLGPNECLEVDGMVIKTLRSTDEGIAFLVYYEGHCIYHAGDLNWWHWEEEGRVYNEMMRRNYQYEISKLKDEKIDVAFHPLDSRQGSDFYLGMDWFMRNTNTKIVFPMHFWDDYEVYEKLIELETSKSYRDKVQKIETENQEFLIGEEDGC